MIRGTGEEIDMPYLDERTHRRLGLAIAKVSLEEGGPFFLRHASVPVDTYLNKNYLCNGEGNTSNRVAAEIRTIIEGSEHRPDAVSGMGVGATMLATLVGYWACLPLVIVREAAKPHSSEDDGLLVGKVTEGMRVMLLEDTVTTGGTVAWVVSLLQSRGVVVDSVVAVCDREMGGRERIEALGIPFTALFTLSELKSLKADGCKIGQGDRD